MASGALLWMAFALGSSAMANPYVTHQVPLETAVTSAEVGRGSERAEADGLVPGMPWPPLRAAEPEVTVRHTLECRQNWRSILAVGGDSDLDTLVLLPRNPGHLGRAERPWLVAARPTRSVATKATSLGTRRPIPEPASLILLITGVIGLYAREFLLRRRA